MKDTPKTLTPPSNVNAEMAVVGSILRNSSTLEDIRLLVSAQMFTDEALHIVFAAMCRLNDKNAPVSPMSIADEIGEMPHGIELGAVLQEAMTAVTSSGVGFYYAAMVAELAKARALISLCSDIERRAMEGDSPTTLLEDMQRTASEIAQRGVVDLGKQASELVDQVWESMTGSDNDGVTGLSTGLPELDVAIGGMRRKHLIAVAAFMKAGKTSFGFGVCAHVAIRERRPAAIITYEMGAEELEEKLILSECNMPLETLRNRLTVTQQSRTEQVKRAIKDCRLILDDTAPSTMSGLRNRLRMLKRMHKIEFACVDYFQLLAGDDPKVRRYDQLVEVSRGLKQMATELDIPILVLAQLNAESQSTERSPAVTDIADCKAIARDANVVLILDRPAERFKNNAFWLQQNGNNLTAATIDVAMIRRGQPQLLQCHFIPGTQRWKTASQQSDDRLDAAYEQRVLLEEYHGETA